jgi:phosphoglycolate phosphatase
LILSAEGLKGMSPFPFRPAMVLIDLDGTLIDSVPDLAWGVNTMLEQLGQPPRSEQAIRCWVGNGVERLVKRALVNHLDGEPAAEVYAEAYPIFLNAYSQHTCVDSCLYPGVREGLDWLHQHQYPLGCVTNKAARFTEPLLDYFKLRHYFQVVVSGDTLPTQKPSPEPLWYAARVCAADPQQSLMIGDSINDVLAARAAQFTVLCMTYGYNHGQDIRTAHPDAVLDSLADLPHYLSPE